ncbi:hypothetical protein V9T40_010405 [Parthenolecanium corni]|uniref:SOWAHA-C winged helix-turn-helix domain-containing protein n=1 Tax=Parthenolecanium corni TaxID=536013 RepID=A0AAN9Y1D9_9HEMI
MPYESMPLVLSADTVRDYILSRGGKVYNTDLVKYFKPLLVHPETKDAAREEFKKIINRIAVVLRDERDEKYLVLKRRSNDQSPINSPEPSLSYSSSYSSLPSGAPLSPAMDPTLIPSFSKQPPPYRSPPPVTPPKVLPSPGMCMSPASSESSMEKTPPPVPPRRRSSDKIKFNNKENESLEGQRNSTTSDDGENKIADEQKISVKERTQRFNRLASTEEPITKIQQSAQTSAACKKRFDKGSVHDRDEEDCVSVTSFDPRSREWLVKSAKNDYHGLAKLCADNPRLAEVKIYSSRGWYDIAAGQREEKQFAKWLIGRRVDLITDSVNRSPAPVQSTE